MEPEDPDADLDVEVGEPAERVRITDDVGEVAGPDGRDYDLAPGDDVALPAEIAAPLVEKGAAERLADDKAGADADGDADVGGDPGEPAEPVRLDGPPEPAVCRGEGERHPGGGVDLLVPTDDGRDLDRVHVPTWECLRCGVEHVTGVENGRPVEPDECDGCERNGPFDAVGDLSADDYTVAARAPGLWRLPAGVDADPDAFGDLWGDVRAYLRDHWDAGEGDDAEAVYHGLTAFALSTWVRPNLAFVPHLMLRGATTGGKTRLLNTLARVSYRAMVSASATPASMFRLIDAYGVTFYISEFHGLEYETQREVANIVRAGQKRGELVTRADHAPTGYEPRAYDPFTHVAVATQYDLDDDVVNRCLQVRSTTATRDMPPTFDEDRGRALRDRLLYARLRLLGPDHDHDHDHDHAGADDEGEAATGSPEWTEAEARAWDHLAEREIEGRTREKLLGLLTVAYVWDRVDDLDPFVDLVVEQDREAATDSEDARVVEVVRDLALERLEAVTVLGDADPFGAVEIPLADVAERYEAMTGAEKSPTWVGHVRARLGFEKVRKRDGTVIKDPDLREKLERLCEDFNLGWDPADVHDPVRELDEDEQYRAACNECGHLRTMTHRHAVEGWHMCNECADEERRVAADD